MISECFLSEYIYVWVFFYYLGQNSTSFKVEKKGILSLTKIRLQTIQNKQFGLSFKCFIT